LFKGAKDTLAREYGVRKNIEIFKCLLKVMYKMLGQNIDYWLLRPFVHARNRATEDELDVAFRNSDYSLSEAQIYLNNINILFGGNLLVNPDLSYLDVGCGMGRLCMGLINAGAKDVTGIDIVPRNIEQAKELANRFDFGNKLELICTDFHNWQADRSYDVIAVLGVMEHIRKPKQFLQELPRLMKIDGNALIGHENFFGPRGDHLRHFFRVQIPWRGVIFSEKALMKLRREFYRPTDPAECLQDIVGGLNKLSFNKFVNCSLQAGLKFTYLNINPSYKKIKTLYLLSQLLIKVPLLNNYFVEYVYAVLKKAESPI
jgi:2-polyprenyl-3-methyl-5-hydroxy-6-metoxy-1,4-benzoquinol methylase